MRIAVFCFTDAGVQLAVKLCGLMGLPKECIHTNERFSRAYGLTGHKSVFEDMGRLFNENEALIFIGACGIAVRAIAPHLRYKATDPAVIVIDDKGRYVIPVLSGHIGGANAMAKTVADMMNAVAVITTATDTSNKFACDAWAASHDCAISSMELAKAVSARILTEDIPYTFEGGTPESRPYGLVNKSDGELGIYIGARIKEPYDRTLRLIQRKLNVGIGCRRSTPKEAIAAAVQAVFDTEKLDMRAIKRIASISLKKYEAGLIAFAEDMGAETAFFTADELNKADGDFSDSAFVKDTVGTGCVCERAAVLAGGELIVKKTAFNGVTVAVAEEKRRSEF